MATPAQKALADALRAFASIIDPGTEPAAEAAPAAPAPKAKAAPKAPAPVNATPADTRFVVPGVVWSMPTLPMMADPATTNGAPDLMADARKAAKAYAGTFGREGLKEILTKYTEGTLADVPPEKLPELLKELS